MRPSRQLSFEWSALARRHSGPATHCRRGSRESSPVQNPEQRHKQPVQRYVGDRSVMGELSGSDPHTSVVPTDACALNFLTLRGFTGDVKQKGLLRSTPSDQSPAQRQPHIFASGLSRSPG